MKDFIKTISLLFLALVALSNTIYAKEKSNTEEFVVEYNFEEDQFSGPGIGIRNNTWDGTYNNVIYSYGNLNGIIGDEIVNALAYSCDGPGTENALMPAVVYNAVGPGFMVNAFTKTLETEYVDMGPQAVDIVISPDSNYKVITATPKELAEACVSLKYAKKKDKESK